MPTEEPITLKEIQLRLGVPQHVLIHLCEKSVIEPDVSDTSGRGTRRKFSQRNVFEFAVALAVRRFELPVATTALILRVLRSFVRAVGKAAPAFALPEALIGDEYELVLSLYDGELLVLSAEGRRFRRPLLVSAQLSGAEPRVSKLDALPAVFEAKLDINLSEIARKSFK